MTRHRVAGVGVAVAMVVTVGALVSSAGRSGAPEPRYAGSVELTLPPTIVAGDSASIEVRAQAKDGTGVDTILIGAYRTVTLRSRLANGTATVPVPSSATSIAGALTVVAAVGDATVQADVVVAPGPPVDPVLPLLGARSIVADGADTAMVVAIPEDAHGNPIGDGERVRWTVRHADGSYSIDETQVDGGLAWRWIRSGTTAGVAYVSAAAGDARGPDALLLEVPGSPVPFGLRHTGGALVADGATLVTVTTDPLTDRHGNPLLDGTAVRFVARLAGDIESVVDTVTVGGRAEAIIEAPQTPGTREVTAVVDGVAGETLDLAFLPAIAMTGIPVEVTEADGGLRVRVGPLYGPLGELVPDGTEVSVKATTRHVGVAREVATVGGVAEVFVADPSLMPDDSTVTVETGGVRVEVGAGR